MTALGSVSAWPAKRAAIVALASLALLTGCDEEAPPSPPSLPASISVLTATGGYYTLAGTHETGCVGGSSHDAEYYVRFDGALYTEEVRRHASRDGSCTGGILETETWTGNLQVFIDINAIDGWVDGTGNLVDPPSANSGILLGPRVPYTALIERDTGHFFNGVPVPVDPATLPSQISNPRAWYQYFIVDDTRGGPIRLWENFCQVLGDSDCKQYARESLPFNRI